MSPSPIWGVDSATEVTQTLYDCVVKQYGKPSYWGRYLTRIEQVSDGLTSREIALLHRNGVKILPIYNQFRKAVGYNHGQVAAMNAIFHAKKLGIPKDIFLFANIEKFFRVDAAWIRGWVDTLYSSDYRPGFYANPVQGGFGMAFCLAVAHSEKVGTQSVIWSSEPRHRPTHSRMAPAFNPAKPQCKSNVWGWQYAENVTCGVDLNLIDVRLLGNLW